MSARAEAPIAVNVDWHLNTIAADPRYARAVAVLPRLIAHMATASADAPEIVLRDRARRSEEFSAWIENGTPMVHA